MSSKQENKFLTKKKIEPQHIKGKGKSFFI